MHVCVCVSMIFFLNSAMINTFCICIVTLFWDSRGREWFSANRVVTKTMVTLWCLRLVAVVGGEDNGRRALALPLGESKLVCLAQCYRIKEML